MTWYKQVPYWSVQLLLSYNIIAPSHVRYAKEINQHRYIVLPRSRPRNPHRLRIISVAENDTATYYCGYSEGKNIGNKKHAWDRADKNETISGRTDNIFTWP
ncbi:hypothetical protein Baya_8479 [Bagarius yarrelli]|uniref:Immunoglobulin V-set domain-containing protein n=1 Tax=Bagarius yarrelli TaxID=175774 RepID=A0A556U5T3_BAGYA|nr:hypothetical protein Baya_8479 [Bagarius yarrelli]